MCNVLIIGPDYFNFLPALERAFSDLGWGARVLGYTGPVHPYRLVNKVKYKLARNKEKVVEKSRVAFQSAAIQSFNEYEPELVFVLNGDYLEVSTLDLFRKSAKVALWFFDSRTKLPFSIGHADHVDALFCFERDDVDWFQSQGKQAFFLPQACDTSQYFPIQGVAKDIDILFVGNLFYSPKRKAVMNAVIDCFPDRKIEVYGWYQPWFKGLKAYLRRPHKRIYKNVNVSSETANLLYNRARVVLNIHQEHQKNGANPRVFEICGSGAYQICDWNPYVASLLPEGSIGLYRNNEELFSLIKDALTLDTLDKALSAHKVVAQNHTFKNRMQFVLETLCLENA